MATSLLSTFHPTFARSLTRGKQALDLHLYVPPTHPQAGTLVGREMAQKQVEGKFRETGSL